MEPPVQVAQANTGTLTDAAPAGSAPRTQPPPAASPGGTGFPLTFGELAMLKANGIDLADLYKLGVEGIKRERGADYYDPVTGRWNYSVKLDEGQVEG